MPAIVGKYYSKLSSSVCIVEGAKLEVSFLREAGQYRRGLPPAEKWAKSYNESYKKGGEKGRSPLSSSIPLCNSSKSLLTLP